MKRKWGILLLLALCAAALAVPAIAGAETGQCGDGLTWTLTADGQLTISGTGKMYSYKAIYSDGIYTTSAPWGNAPVTVEIQGAANIGDYAIHALRRSILPTPPRTTGETGS